MRVDVGDKIYIPGEKRPYTVQCRDDRYIICTKPFNLRHTVQYFIIDLVDKILATKKANLQADTSKEESEINRLVYALYGLSEDEIKIVEGR